MSTIKDQIEKAVGKSASELTEMVTEIGEGSFPKGLERIRKDGVDEGLSLIHICFESYPRNWWQ